MQTSASFSNPTHWSWDWWKNIIAGLENLKKKVEQRKYFTSGFETHLKINFELPVMEIEVKYQLPTLLHSNWEILMA